MNQKIIKRIFYRIEYELASPLAISNGNEIHTDSDVILDASGAPFIPGTSIAGAVRNYLTGKDDAMNALFGWTGKDEGRMSPLWIYDSFFDEPEQTKISVRDGVKLNDEINFDDETVKANSEKTNGWLRMKEKTVVEKGKFDMEIVETGAKGTAFLQLIIREHHAFPDTDKHQNQFYTKDEAEKIWMECLQNIAIAVNHGDIRFGSKKNRGMGKIKLNRIQYKEFDQNALSDWIAFDPFDSQAYIDAGEVQIAGLKQTFDSPFLTLKTKLNLPGGISIRQYSAVSGEADFGQIRCNNVAVVPGSSWSGAIRNQSAKLLRLLGMPPLNIERALNEWFGPVFKDAKKAKLKQSNVVISESILHDCRTVTMTRNKINRFTSATVNGALYTESAAFDGKNIELEIKIRKKESECEAFECEVLAGLLILVIKDIQKGYCAIGGQTAVGRGIFCAADNADVFEGEEHYLRALADYVRKSKGGTIC